MMLFQILFLLVGGGPLFLLETPTYKIKGVQKIRATKKKEFKEKAFNSKVSKLSKIKEIDALKNK